MQEKLLPVDMAVFMGSDHAGVRLKRHLAGHLEGRGVCCFDCGAFSEEIVDWPPFAFDVCGRVLREGGMGLLICGSGIGMCMAANRIPGIRAVLCANEYQARFARAHNDANLLCLGERVTGPGLAALIVDVFRETAYDGGIHDKRLAMMEGGAERLQRMEP